MAKKPISSEHHVLRWASHEKLVYETSPDGSRIVVGFHPETFKHRIIKGKKEPYLSAAWVEYYEGLQDDNVKAAARATYLHVRKRAITATSSGAFALGNAGDILDDCASRSSPVRIFSNGKPAHPSYAEVWDVDDGDEALLTLLATESWSNIVLPADVAPDETTADGDGSAV